MRSAGESFENLIQGLNGKLGDIVNIQADAQENPLGAVQGIAKEGLQAIEKWSHSGFLKSKPLPPKAAGAPAGAPAGSFPAPAAAAEPAKKE